MPSTELHTSHTWSGRMCVRPSESDSFSAFSVSPIYKFDTSPQCASTIIYTPLWPCCLPQLFQCSASSPRALAGSTVIRNGSRSPASLLCCDCFAVESPVECRHLWTLLVRPSGCISNQPIPVVLQQPHRHFGSTSACDFRPGARAHISIFW
jgi:hypothetical protein